MEKQIEIKTLKIKNYGCIKDLEISLSPLHAVIGPNDSGKTSLLRAARTGVQMLFDRFYSQNNLKTIQIHPFNPGLNEGFSISLSLISKLPKQLDCNYEIKWKTIDEIQEDFSFSGMGLNVTSASTLLNRRIWEVNGDLRNKLQSLRIRYKTPRMIRLDPDSLRASGGLISSSDEINIEEKGIGLASVLDSLIKRNIDAYQFIRKRIQALFPPVSDLILENISNNELQITIKLKNGEIVKPEFISEGMLYYLAFSCLQYLEPASLLLIEEPENGLHPSRIKEVMSIIRELSKTTQVLIATHSPLVINELNPEEVTILWRDEEKGTRAMPMAETANFKERSGIYAPGELWLSYADGIKESELRMGKE